MGKPGAPKGHKRYGGRAKGTPNKRTEELQDFFDSKGMFIPEMIVEKLHLLDDEKQIDVLLDLMPYLYPKRKAIEHSGEIEMPSPKINEESLEDRVKRLKGK